MLIRVPPVESVEARGLLLTPLLLVEHIVY